MRQEMSGESMIICRDIELGCIYSDTPILIHGICGLFTNSKL